MKQKETRKCNKTGQIVYLWAGWIFPGYSFFLLKKLGLILLQRVIFVFAKQCESTAVTAYFINRVLIDQFRISLSYPVCAFFRFFPRNEIPL